MNLYNFLNHNNTGFLTNFLSQILKGTVKFVEYEEVTRNSKKDANGQYVYENPEVTIKVFKFGLNGEVFEFFIAPDNRIVFYFHSANLKPEHSILLGSSLTNSNVESVRLNLLSILRDYKINQII